MIGTTLGSRYILEQLEGTEGPSEIYSARDEVSGKTVLVSVLAPNSDPWLAAEFLEVAKKVQQIQNERLPRVLDTGEDSGMAFVAVEKVDGASLDQVVKGRARMSIADAVGLVYQGLRAVEAAVAAGFSHGRIEPRRLMVQEDGLLKLTGLELRGLGESLPFALAYSAPEVKKGLAADVRSDVYSLGVVLFELLSGRLPFPEDAPADAEPAPLRYLRPDAPREIQALLDKALDPDPDRRPQSAEDMVLALEAAIEGKPYELASPVEVMTPESEPLPSTPAPAAGTSSDEPILPGMGSESAPRAKSKRPLFLAVAVVAIAVLGGGGWIATSGVSGGRLSAAPAPTVAPTAPPPTEVPTRVPPTATPTRQPTATPVPTPQVVKTYQEKDPIGRQWNVSEMSDGTTTRTEIVPAPVLASANARMRALQMFESGADGLALEKRQYATRFPKATTRYINYELDLAYPDPGKVVNFTLRAFYYDSSDKLIVIQTQNAHIEGGWTQSFHWNGYGWPDAGRWDAGKYRLDLYDGTAKLSSINFEIY